MKFQKIELKELGKIPVGQDGAIYGNYIFRFEVDGRCRVAKLDTLELVCEFVVDGADYIVPHSNSVCFGKKLNETDEFPLLYTNVYNNYSRCEDKREGTCCVYRIFRVGNTFSSRLVQIIKVGFTDVNGLWRSNEGSDVRPYGNFSVDAENNKLYAFTMVDDICKTRFFAFALPDVNACGDEVETVVLSQSDIISSFDSEYSHYLQGAIFHKGLILSVEGFTGSDENPPALRIFNVNDRTQVLAADLRDYSLYLEPEFIEIAGGEVLYSDCNGNFYKIDME